MSLGNRFYHARKKRGLSQEEAAENLGVSRQMISKWELDETLPDICQAQRLAGLYGVSLDELMKSDREVEEIQELIEKTEERVSKKVDWAKVWSKKYPILSTYQDEVNIGEYAAELGRLLRKLQKEYGYRELDALLVLKDILGKVWKNQDKPV